MKQPTEDADSVSFMVVLHEELVTIHYVLVEVPRDRLIEDSSSKAEERPHYTGLEVRPDAGLPVCGTQFG